MQCVSVSDSLIISWLSMCGQQSTYFTITHHKHMCKQIEVESNKKSAKQKKIKKLK